MTVTGRSVQDIDFSFKPRGDPKFSEVFAREDDTSDEGLVQAIGQGKYADFP